MKNYRKAFIFVLVGNVTFIGVLAGFWWRSHHPNGTKTATAPAATPATPNRRQVPPLVYRRRPRRRRSSPVQLSPERLQSIGVKFGVVERKDIERRNPRNGNRRDRRTPAFLRADANLRPHRKGLRGCDLSVREERPAAVHDSQPGTRCRRARIPARETKCEKSFAKHSSGCCLRRSISARFLKRALGSNGTSRNKRLPGSNPQVRSSMPWRSTRLFPATSPNETRSRT